MTENINFTNQSYAIYIQKLDQLIAPFIWAGRKAQLGAIASPYGAVTTTTAFNPRGGLYKDGTLVAEPDAVTSELMIKHEQHSRMRSSLLNASFSVDKRAHIGGKDKDSPTRWTDIQRLVNARVTDRTTPESTSAGEEESIITLPISAQFDIDIYRTAYTQIGLDTLEAAIIAVAEAVPATNRDKGIMYAVSEVNITELNVNVLINRNGGEASFWEIHELDAVTDDPQSIVGFGNFVGVLFDNYFLRSDTYGEAFSQVSPVSWANMNNVFGLDQTAVFAVGDNGFISRSTDGGRTWTTSLQAGTVTTQNLTGGYVVDGRVVYVCGAGGAVLRSNDFGTSWFLIETNLVQDILSIVAPNREVVFMLGNNGIVYQSDDGGDTIIAQEPLEGLPATTYTSGSIMQLGGGVYFIMLADATNSYIYRNVDSAFTGYWYVPANVGNDAILYDAVMLNNNLLLAVGGGVDDNVVVSVR